MRNNWNTYIAWIAILLITSCGQVQPVIPAASPTVAIHPAGSITATPTGFQDPAEETVRQLIADKIKAMQAKDIEQYLELVNESDHEYYTEQRNWFLIYQDAVTSDFSIEVQSVEKIDDTTLAASLKQHYLYGPEKADRTITYEEKYILTPDGWKDADMNFEVQETAHFLVKYPQTVAQKAAEVCEQAERGYASVVKELGLEPPGKVSIKLYADQELLRQSTDIRIAYLFNGWNEDGESIKLFAWREKAAFAPIIAHELTHKITLGITDSLNSWLAEGLAVYFGNQPLRGGNPLDLGQFSAKELSQPISWLEDANLIQMTNAETIKLYYAVSSMVVEFMVETYGLGGVKALLGELSKNPRYDRGFDYDQMEVENQKRLHQAIENAFGVDMDTFNQGWLRWIELQE